MSHESHRERECDGGGATDLAEHMWECRCSQQEIPGEASRSVPGETSMNEKLETREQEGGMAVKPRVLGASVSTE